MKRAIYGAVIVLAGCQAQLNTAPEIVIRNNSPNPLVCYQVVKEGENEEVGSVIFEINGISHKKLKSLLPNNEIACQHETKSKHHTFLTYFNVISKGEYKLTLEEIGCNSCGNQKTRPATIVQFPNGEKQNEVF